jgi:hypothetical protein
MNLSRTRIDEAVTKLCTDLAWRGPNGKQQRTICLPRDLAEALVDGVTMLTMIVQQYRLDEETRGDKGGECNDK